MNQQNETNDDIASGIAYKFCNEYPHALKCVVCEARARVIKESLDQKDSEAALLQLQLDRWKNECELIAWPRVVELDKVIEMQQEQLDLAVVALKQYSDHDNWCASLRSKLRKCDCEACPASEALDKIKGGK